MKEFEKWDEENFSRCLMCDKFHIIRHREEGWKAALEWALSKQKQICDDNCPIQVIPTFVIEEELQK